MKVLFVDDEPDFSEQARLFLEKENEQFEVVTATSAKEALEMLNSSNYDAIVSDYQMPEMDGLELLGKVREERDSDIPFIIFTGKGREEVAMKALNLGADRYLQKGGDSRSQYGVLAQAIVQEVMNTRLGMEKKKVEAKLSSLVEGSEDPIFIVDEDCRFTFGNQAELEVHDVSREEWIGLKFHDLHPEEDAQTFEKKVQKVLETGESQRQVVNHIESDKYIDRTLSPVKNPQTGKVDRVSVISKDITNQKEMGKEIKYRESLERIITEVSTCLMDARMEEIDDCIDEALKKIGEFAGADRSYIFQFYDDLEKMDNTHEWCAEGVEPQKDNLQNLSTDTYPWWMEKLKIFENIPIPKVSDLPPEAEAEKEILQVQNIKSLIVLPMISSNSLKGFIGFDWVRKEEEWSEEIIKLLRIAGETIASALERKEIREKYRILSEGSSNGIYLFQGGEFKYVNEAMVELSGYSREELRDMNFLELIHPDYREDIVRWTEQALEGDSSGLPEKAEVQALREDGDSVWVQITPSLVEYDGKPAIVGNVSDITKRKRAEEKLQEEKRNYKELFEKSADALFVHDPETGEILDVNQRMCEMYGYSREEALEQTIGDLSSGEHPYTQEEAEKWVRKVKSEGSQTFEWRAQEKDGTLLWVEVTLKQAEIGGEMRVLASVRDITERKEAERRFDWFFDKMPDFAFILDEEGVVEEMNETAFRETGYDRDEVVGKRLDELPGFLPEVDREKTLERFDRLKKGEELPPVTVKLRTKDGNEKYYEMVSMPVQENVNSMKIIGISRDVTRRVLAEEREEFLHSLLRHDVRNKAQIVQGYHELLQDCDLPEEAEDFVRKAEKGVEDSMDLIEKVRTLQSIDREEEIKKISIGSFIRNVISERESEAKEKGMEIEYEEISCKVLGGPLLEELFSNLIENSIRHSGGSMIRITSQEKENECIITVEDDGQGILDENKEKIFERGFKRGDTAGSGLGMYLVKQIIEIYNGSVEIKDSDFGGARFEINLKKA